jgi:hypothetical protein
MGVAKLKRSIVGKRSPRTPFSGIRKAQLNNAGSTKHRAAGTKHRAKNGYVGAGYHAEDWTKRRDFLQSIGMYPERLRERFDIEREAEKVLQA